MSYSYRDPAGIGLRHIRNPDMSHRNRDVSPIISESEVGEFVSRRLLPTMLHQSDRPLKVVMNYGNLYYEEDDHHHSHSVPRPSHHHHHTVHDRTKKESNTIIFNAPGSHMAVGGGTTTHRDGGPMMMDRAASPQLLELEIRDRDRLRVAMCLGCFKRQLVHPATGYCDECDVFVTSTRETLELRGLPATSGPGVTVRERHDDHGHHHHRDESYLNRDGVAAGIGIDIGTGVRHVRGVSPGGWARREMRERERQREEERLRRRRDREVREYERKLEMDKRAMREAEADRRFAAMNANVRAAAGARDGTEYFGVHVSTGGGTGGGRQRDHERHPGYAYGYGRYSGRAFDEESLTDSDSLF